jgi:serine/threonine-protein kinase HipA
LGWPAPLVTTGFRPDLLRAFRQRAFNLAAHNCNDRAKNFAFVLDAGRGERSLSPAYDLSFAPGPGGEHSMTTLGEGRSPTREHVLCLAMPVDLNAKEADILMGEVNDAVARRKSLPPTPAAREKPPR